ncbi:MAG: hypothetical protein SNJ75_02225 [Gemmataceae bacterium]
MTRITWLATALGVAISLVGCHTLTKTQGVCDCNAPPVESLLVSPTLPPHVCAHPHYHGVHAPTAAPKLGEPPVVPAPAPVEPRPIPPKPVEPK